jgi:hypothetical protein
MSFRTMATVAIMVSLSTWITASVLSGKETNTLVFCSDAVNGPTGRSIIGSNVM